MDSFGNGGNTVVIVAPSVAANENCTIEDQVQTCRRWTLNNPTEIKQFIRENKKGAHGTAQFGAPAASSIVAPAPLFPLQSAPMGKDEKSLDSSNIAKFKTDEGCHRDRIKPVRRRSGRSHRMSIIASAVMTPSQTPGESTPERRRSSFWKFSSSATDTQDNPSQRRGSIWSIFQFFSLDTKRSTLDQQNK